MKHFLEITFEQLADYDMRQVLNAGRRIPERERRTRMGGSP